MTAAHLRQLALEAVDALEELRHVSRPVDARRAVRRGDEDLLRLDLDLSLVVAEQDDSGGDGTP